MAASTGRKRGRPPAGNKPGERVTDYPQLSIHVPDEVRDQLQALATITGQPQWRILSEAVDCYIAEMPDAERQLVHKMVERAQPILSRPAKTHGNGQASNGDLASVRILNVDDNEAMLFARSAMLRKEGFEVLEAQTGRRAIQMLEMHRPRLVLLDVNLPDMSGLDICRQIKTDPQWRDVKVIQVSATFSSPHDQLYGLENGGADIYLAEPVQRGTLLSVVRRLLTA